MKRASVIGKWVAIVAVVLIASLLVLNAFFVWSTGTQLERRLRELRESGSPVQLVDFVREPIAPASNAETFLRRAADDVDAIHKELAAMYPKTAQPPEAPSPGELEKLDKLFSAYPRVWPLLEQAAACTDYDPQLDGTLPTTRFLEPYMGRTGKHRELARVFRARCTLLIAEGRRDLAVANQIVLLRLIRHWRREPLLIGYLVTVACEQTAMAGVNQALQAGPVPAATRKLLDEELALHDSMEGYIWAMKSERAHSLSSVREMPMTGYWLLRGFMNDLQVRIIELYDQFIDQTPLSYSQVIAQPPTRSGPGGMNPYGALVTLLVPALNAAREPAERVKAMSRCLRVLSALQARTEAGSDRTPQLGDLGLSRETTIDPYNGEPLHVKKMPEGWLVYSLGMNLTDEGGMFDKAADVGAGPMTRSDVANKP
jgi:hypothetical protein